MNAEKDPIIVLGEEQCRKFGNFLSDLKANFDSLKFTNTVDSIPKLNKPLIKVAYNTDNENISLFQLLESDNKVLTKILMVFAALKNETLFLCEESKKQFQQIFIYLDDDLNNLGLHDDQKKLTNQEYNNLILVKFSANLNHFINFKFLVQKIVFVIQHCVQQLVALFTNDKYLDVQITNYFPGILDDLGSLFYNLLVFDKIIDHSNFKNQLKVYKKSLQSSSPDENSKFDENLLRCLSNTINEIELLLQNSLLEVAFDKIRAFRINIRSKVLQKLSNFIMTYLKNLIMIANKLEDKVLSEFSEIETIHQINLLSAFHQILCENFDQKLFKNIMEINNKHCGITLIGGIMWNHIEFFQKYMKGTFKTCKVNKDINKCQQLFLNSFISELNRDVNGYAVQISLWMLQLLREARIGSDNINQDALKFRSALINQGLQFAGQISYLIKSVTNLHIKFGVAMQKQCLQSIYKLIEYLKIIKFSFQQNAVFFADTIGFIIQYWQFQALFIVQNAVLKVIGETSNKTKFDVLSALHVVENLLRGSGTKNRFHVACLALNFSEPVATFGLEYLAKLQQVIWHLKVHANLQDTVEQVCDSTFLFWHQNLLPAYLKKFSEQNIDQQRISQVLSFSDDCVETLKELNVDMRFDNLTQFEEMFAKRFHDDVVKKLCNFIEINLRLDFHWNLQVEKFNPFEINNKLNIVDRRKLIRMGPIRLNNNYIVVRDQVEHYLSNMFYSLTTVSLHDWKTYGEMRFLAEKKYDLNTVEDHLPSQTLEQGLDVLEIMRNIHTFVSTYLYNLNNQVFIEQSSNNKHLNTISIRHIANSLRTHGIGIVNTTVNYIYQFLRKKFFTFSQFMFDEHIKSRLIKDLKYYRENLEKSDVYSYERANAFNRDIKTLGLSDSGESYLDLFRKLISHIGNAMGYVRMVRSGGLNACSNASVFLPTLDEDLNFVALSKECNLSEATVKAAENLENDIQNLSRNVAEGTKYFKLLVDTFAPFIQNPKNTHLKNFYIIVPPLTINFIEYILRSKDKLNKKDKNGALFTDDGFAMGVIFILKLLDQISDFNALNWYRAIKNKIKMEREKIDNARKQTDFSNDEKLSQTLLLSEKRLNLFQQEFELLFYNLSSAKIFFQ